MSSSKQWIYLGVTIVLSIVFFQGLFRLTGL
jgi:hypothetical protein